MLFLNYEEQAIIKMYHFKTKEELKEKLRESLSEIIEEDLKEIVKNLISKIDNFSLDDLKNINNIFE